jgi:CheY-like chemotaxis protein
MTADETAVPAHEVADPRGGDGGDADSTELARLARLGRLTAGVAHDLNNVLAVVSLRLDRLGGRELDQASRADLVLAQDALARTTRLVANLMSVARPGQPSDSRIDLNDRMTSMRGLLADLLGPAVTLEMQLDATRSVVALHEAQLSQIVVNLVVNAREAMRDGGTVRITTSDETVISQLSGDGSGPPLPPGGYVRVDVVDTGEGVSPTLASRIFEPFFTTKQQELGSGLGLATVHEVVTQAGGFITMRSAAGQGSTFSFWLPCEVAEQDPPSPNDDVHHQIDLDRDDRPLVLVVEDDDDFRVLLVEELRSRGYRVAEAADGLGAMDFDDPRIQLLVTDVRLPDFSGPDLARRLVARWPELPVVFMTGHQPERVAEMLPPDAVLFTKPFNVDRLDSTIRSILAPH